MKTLVIFDFDDTLFRSGAMVGVQKPGQQKKYLSSHEYATYVPEEGDEFDYEQFAVYPPKPEPIDQSTDQLRGAVRSHGLRNVVILTARANPAPVKQVLTNFGMPPVEVLAIGSSNPEHKADEVERLVDEMGYERVVVYEDSKNNIGAIRRRVKQMLPAGAFQAFLVKATPRGEVLLPEAARAARRASRV